MDIEKAKNILIELSTFDYVKLENGNEAIETVLNELENADLVINEMSWQLLKEGFCTENDKKDCCRTDDCEECIKEYFYENERKKRKR